MGWYSLVSWEQCLECGVSYQLDRHESWFNTKRIHNWNARDWLWHQSSGVHQWRMERTQWGHYVSIKRKYAWIRHCIWTDLRGCYRGQLWWWWGSVVSHLGWYFMDEWWKYQPLFRERLWLGASYRWPSLWWDNRYHTWCCWNRIFCMGMGRFCVGGWSRVGINGRREQWGYCCGVWRER